MKMVDSDIKTSNATLQVLEHWESYLKAEHIDIPKLLKEAESEGGKLSDVTLSYNPNIEPTLHKPSSKDTTSGGALSNTFPAKSSKVKQVSTPHHPSAPQRGPSR